MGLGIVITLPCGRAARAEPLIAVQDNVLRLPIFEAAGVASEHGFLPYPDDVAVRDVVRGQARAARKQVGCATTSVEELVDRVISVGHTIVSPLWHLNR